MIFECGIIKTMEQFHRYRTHIYVFVAGLAIATLCVAVGCYRYNPTYADFQTTASNVALTSDPSTWKGVNLPLKIRPLPGKVAKLLAQSDFDSAANVGANVVGIKIFADPQGEGTSASYSDFTDANGNVLPAATSPGIADLQAAVAMAAKDNLKVIFAMQTNPGTTGGAIWTSQAEWNTLTSMWATIATTFKNNPNVLAFDLMNEPNVLTSLDPTTQLATSKQMTAGTWTIPAAWLGTPRDYNAEMSQVITAVRAADATRTVIVESFGQAAQPTNFRWMTPISGFSNVVYSLHMYVPTALTFIGQTKYTANDDPNRPFLYPANESQITNAFAPAIAFQQKYNVPIYVGEFGIEDGAIYGTDPTTGDSYNGSCWMSSVMSQMDAQHWGWDFFDFWTPGRVPLSITDPRYLALTSDMKQGIVPDFCTNPPVLNSTAGSLLPPVVVTPPVTIPPDTTPPTIILLGSSSLTLTVGDTFTDPGVTANDSVDGDLTSSVNTTGYVDTSTAGTYTITYKVTDAAGNTASAVRSVTVNPAPVTDTPPPSDSYTVSTPSSSGVTTTVSQPLSGSVSGAIQFNVQPAVPVVTTTNTTTATSTGTTTVTTTAPSVAAPTIKPTVTTTTTPVTTSTPTKTVVTTTNPVIVSNTTQASTTLTSITYTLNGTLIHTSTTFPDTWNFNTTTIPNGAYNLTTTYHYANNTTKTSITIFTVKNDQTFIESITGTLQDVWLGFLSWVQGVRG
jgi:hypothetical protein